MYVQYSQGLPGVVINEPAGRIYIDTLSDDYAGELEAAYERYLAEDLDYFAIGREYACGLYEFTERPLTANNYLYIKGQIIGPISFGLSITDQDKKAIIYNQEFCECLTKVLSMKARWQIKKLRSGLGAQDGEGLKGQAAKGPTQAKIIIFIDEPYLVAVGSSFFNISAARISAMLNEIAQDIHKEGAFAGLHCCGNTDWSLVLGSDIDILSFDGYNYLDQLFLYRDELDKFSRRGGVLSWGMVPTVSGGDLPAAASLIEKMRPRL